jgi:hypothetical protein
MAFAVNTPAGQVRLEDLPLEVLEAVEVQTGQEWPTMIFAPASSAKVANALYKAVCVHKGCEPEQLTPKSLLNGLYEKVDDDVPTLFEDGIPKAEDEEQTLGSSGVPASSGGPQT